MFSGIAKAAIVIPAMASPRSHERSYARAHWRMGRYCTNHGGAFRCVAAIYPSIEPTTTPFPCPACRTIRVFRRI
jgi:hypothetical protein